jgi:biotin operon repressor
MSAKKNKVLELLKTTFYSQADISREVGVSEKYVSIIVNELSKSEQSQLFREKMEAYRLECVKMLVQKINKFHFDDESFPLQLAGMQRLCKMMGWEAAQEVNVNVSAPTQIIYEAEKIE